MVDPSNPPDDRPELPGEKTTIPRMPREARKVTIAGSSESDFRHGRFEPGQRLGSRYRIVALLGEGGMGQVYRADDLELGQSVALKFLPERVAADAAWLRRFRNEVRTARQIAHPNVCRIYDIAEQDGHVFLSMEYIDGEDLAGVLRRLGRPSREKAIEIARQICLGLAAAHENKVLHRDLKPANIMIDGRGHVRITDFGLAGFLDELEQVEARAGTPAYMAPEQLAHGKVSVRSDIYTLGLILHELFTGKCVFETNDIEELKRKHTSGSVTPPSSITEEIDPAVERVIMRCLQEEPEQRPQSVYQVLAALPGGDPLAAALAAGELPSPELIANAGERGGLSTRAATLLTLWIAGVALVAVLISSTWIVPKEPGVVLATRAAEIVRALGYEELPENSAWGFNPNVPYLERLLESGDTSWERLNGDVPPAVVFWRRWSPAPLIPHRDFHQPFPTFNDPSQTEAGSISIFLDGDGRLVGLNVEPDRTAAPASDAGDPWSALLERAGLTDPTVELVETTHPRAISPDKAMHPLIAYSQPPPSDETREWKISSPEALGGKLLVRAAAFRGRPVYFLITEYRELADEIASGVDEQHLNRAVSWVGEALRLVQQVLWPVIMIVAAVLAVRNVRAGRGDRRGAMLAGLLMFGIYLVIEVTNYRLGEQGIPGVLNELTGGRSLGHALLHGFQIWISYLALEPYVRRIWPHLLVGWARLISGRWRDPLVGREVLIGLSLGMVIYLLGPIGADAVAEIVGVAGFPPRPHSWATLGITSPTMQLYVLCIAMTTYLHTALVVLLLLLVVRMVTGKVWIAIVATLVLYTVAAPRWFFGVFTYAESPLLLTGTVWSFVYAAVIALALLRFGLVCALAAHVGMTLLWWMVGTTDLGDWHASSMLVMLGVLGAFTAYGVWTSTANRSF